MFGVCPCSIRLDDVGSSRKVGNVLVAGVGLAVTGGRSSSSIVNSAENISMETVMSLESLLRRVQPLVVQ